MSETIDKRVERYHGVLNAQVTALAIEYTTQTCGETKESSALRNDASRACTPWAPCGSVNSKTAIEVSFLPSDIESLGIMTMNLQKSAHTERKHYCFKVVDSPIGHLKLVASDRGLAGVLWAIDRPGRVNLLPESEDKNHKILLTAEKQLKEYFAGARTVFDLPLDFHGTAFQKSVWRALVKIPFGETRTYGEIAKDLGNPKAVRAVGAANGRNPIAIVAPCHRVIGANGTLTGFAGGLKAKAHLLNIENKGAKMDPRSVNAKTRMHPLSRSQ